jgi:transposase
VHHRGSEAQADLAVAKSRAALVRTRTKLVNHIRGLVKSFGERLPSCTAESFHRNARGVGTLTALVFLLTLEDKTRFTKSRTVGAFIGFNPKRDQSGDCDKQLGIAKTGDAFMRRLAVGSANYILGPFGQDCELRRWALELAKRGGRNAKKRATVAVARKLVVLMHRLWVTGEVYQPLGYKAQRSTAA